MLSKSWLRKFPAKEEYLQWKHRGCIAGNVVAVDAVAVAVIVAVFVAVAAVVVVVVVVANVVALHVEVAGGGIHDYFGGNGCLLGVHFAALVYSGFGYMDHGSMGVLHDA